jgi:two-component system LytT family response regulator
MMKNIKTVVIDDEPGNIITLTKIFEEYCPNIEVVATANDILSGEIAIQKHDPQLVFLDIEMPNGNGFDLLNKLAPIHFEVVFVTAYNDYAIKAFKHSAVDYILKPVSITELKNAIVKVNNRLEQNQLNEQIESLLSNLKTDPVGRKKIGIHTTKGIVFEEIDNIMHLQAITSYCNIFFKEKSKLVTSKSLGEIEDILPKNIFFRIHKSHLININYIKQYYKGRGGYIEMEDGTTIEVSTRKRDDFLKLMEGERFIRK